MRLIGREVLDKFKRKHPDARSQVDLWSHDIREADWKTLADLKRDYPNASLLSQGRVIFNIKGNQYRLVVIAVLVAGTISVEWAGSHAEYDKLDFTGNEIKRKR